MKEEEEESDNPNLAQDVKTNIDENTIVECVAGQYFYINFGLTKGLEYIINKKNNQQ